MKAAFDKGNQRAGPRIRGAQALHDGFKSLTFKPELIRFTATGLDKRLGWEMQIDIPSSISPMVASLS